MADAIHAISVLAGICIAAMFIGGSLVFGIATVCRWLKWAPVNTAINIYTYAGAEVTRDDVGGSPK